MVALPSRQVREISVIAGPYDQFCPKCANSHFGPDGSDEPTTWCDQCPGTGKIHHDCVLYTMFGGPVAPKEIGNANPAELEASVQFWSQHALSDPDRVVLTPGAMQEAVLDPHSEVDAQLIRMMVEEMAEDEGVEVKVVVQRAIDEGKDIAHLFPELDLRKPEKVELLVEVEDDPGKRQQIKTITGGEFAGLRFESGEGS